MNQCIAERHLVFSVKGESARLPLVIRIFAPYKAKGTNSKINFDEEAACCTVEFDGLPGMKAHEIYGADSLQALQLAANVEPTLKGFSKSYDFFFP
ncbi:MAG: hypothetical protein P4L83_01000 [Nevskia sp.]|nr:hypothetical protein [Nevskia sp.]